MPSSFLQHSLSIWDPSNFSKAEMSVNHATVNLGGPHVLRKSREAVALGEPPFRNVSIGASLPARAFFCLFRSACFWTRSSLPSEHPPRLQPSLWRSCDAVVPIVMYTIPLRVGRYDIGVLPEIIPRLCSDLADALYSHEADASQCHLQPGNLRSFVQYARHPLGIQPSCDALLGLVYGFECAA